MKTKKVLPIDGCPKVIILNNRVLGEGGYFFVCFSIISITLQPSIRIAVISIPNWINSAYETIYIPPFTWIGGYTTLLNGGQPPTVIGNTY